MQASLSHFCSKKNLLRLPRWNVHFKRAQKNVAPCSRAEPENKNLAPTATESGENGAKPFDTAVDCAGAGQNVVCSPSGAKKVPEAREAEAQLPEQNSGILGSFGFLLLISPFFFWGTAMVAMKLAAAHSTPLFTATVRLIPAGAVVVAWAKANNKPDPDSSRAWAAVAAFALVDGTLFQGFLAEGLQRVPAGIGSVIIDSQPITVAVVAALLFGESITATGVLGLFMGVSGLLLLQLPEQQLQSLYTLNFSSMQLALDGSLWENGQLLMLLAAQCMAAGTLMVPVITKYVDPVMATGWHMILGGIPLIALSLLTEREELFSNLAQLTPGDVVALGYTSLLGSAAAYGVFFYFASKGNLARLSSLTFLTPIFASVAGFGVLGETFNQTQLGGAALTLAGIVLMNKRESP